MLVKRIIKSGRLKRWLYLDYLARKFKQLCYSCTLTGVFVGATHTTSLPFHSYFGYPANNFPFKGVSCIFCCIFFVIHMLLEVELNYYCCSYLLPGEITKPY